MATRQYWLIKSEPHVYPWSKLVTDKRTDWTGVRNFEARNNLRAMKKGDLCLYYHSGDGKALVGIAKVVSPPAPDATAPGEDWASVQVAPHKSLTEPLTLATVKATKSLQGFVLVTRSRLSVAAVPEDHFLEVLKLTKTKL